MAEMGGVWTDEQNDAIVADYFAMLADDIVGRPYSKAEYNRLSDADIELACRYASFELNGFANTGVKCSHVQLDHGFVRNDIFFL